MDLAQHSPPRPVATRVHGLVTDSATASPLAAVVKAYLGGKLLAEAASDPKTGAYEIKCTPAARLEVNAKGYVAASTHVFFHTGAPSVIRAIHTNESGKGAAVLAEEATYERMRLAAGEAKIAFKLKPWPATTP